MGSTGGRMCVRMVSKWAQYHKYSPIAIAVKMLYFIFAVPKKGMYFVMRETFIRLRVH